jgi:protein subunit release factor A
MGELIAEIRAAEGGLDSKLLVIDQFNIYNKMGELEGL